MSGPVRFVDAPPPASPAGRPSKWAAVVAQLKDNPGHWALVAEGAATRGVVDRLVSKYGLEVAIRRRSCDGKFDIYARWPSPDDAD